MLHITSYYLYFVAAKPYSLVSTTTNGWFQFGIKNEASLCTLYILVTVLYSVDYSMDWLGDLQEPPIVHGNNHGFQLQKSSLVDQPPGGPRPRRKRPTTRENHCCKTWSCKKIWESINMVTSSINMRYTYNVNPGLINPKRLFHWEGTIYVSYCDYLEGTP